MNWIGTVASIATLTLFVMYLFGRVWTAKIATKVAQEEFGEPSIREIEDLEDYEKNYYIVDDCVEVYSFIFKMPIQALSVYPIIEDEQGKNITPKDVKPLIELKEFFRENTKIYLRIENPEGYATRRIWVKRLDYVEVSFAIGYNGKGDEALTPEQYTVKNTIRSYLYYLMR